MTGYDPVPVRPILRGFAEQVAYGWQAGGFARIEGAIGALEPLMVEFCGPDAGRASRWMAKVERVREVSRRNRRETVEARIVNALADYLDRHALAMAPVDTVSG